MDLFFGSQDDAGSRVEGLLHSPDSDVLEMEIKE
jgi:hypothetical protein